MSRVRKRAADRAAELSPCWRDSRMVEKREELIPQPSAFRLNDCQSFLIEVEERFT